MRWRWHRISEWTNHPSQDSDRIQATVDSGRLVRYNAARGQGISLVAERTAASACEQEGAVPGPPIDLHVYDDEAALLEGLHKGEPDACTCLVKRFAPLVYARALRMVGDPDEAEGVLQVTFMKACEKFDSFEGRSALGSWLYRIATNEALMQLRRRPAPAESIDEMAETIQPADIPHNLHAWPLDPAVAALDTELRGQLERALTALPESLRTVFVLRELHGLSTEETAAALDLGESAVKVRLHRARLRLRELLANYLAAEGGT